MQTAIVQVTQLRMQRLFAQRAGERTGAHAIGLPPITLAERVGASQATLGIQRVRHQCGHGAHRTHWLLVEQHRRFARDEGRVELRLGKRRAAHHLPQELHIGG